MLHAAACIFLMPLKLTLAIIKPDAAAHPIFNSAILQLLVRQNFIFVKSGSFILSRKDAEEFYSQHREKFYYRRLTSFLSSGQIFVHVLAHSDAIGLLRHLIGPTKSYRARFEAPETIRGSYGISDTRNSIHGSDSDKAAEAEIKFFFPRFNYHEWIIEKNIIDNK